MTLLKGYGLPVAIGYGTMTKIILLSGTLTNSQRLLPGKSISTECDNPGQLFGLRFGDVNYRYGTGSLPVTCCEDHTNRYIILGLVNTGFNLTLSPRDLDFPMI